MGRTGVHGLHEGFLGDLPVAGHAPLHVGDGDRAFEVVVLEVLGQHAEVFQQRGCVLVLVDEHEAAPAFHPHLRQLELAGFEMLEVPGGGHALEVALQVPGEAVVRAAQLVGGAAAHAQRTATVQAGVVEAADDVVLAAHDDDRSVDDVVHQVVAGLLDLFLAADHLPGLRPQFLRFQLVEPARAVALHREVVVAVVPGGGLEVRGDRHRFLFQQVLEQSGLARLFWRKEGELRMPRVVHLEFLLLLLAGSPLSGLRGWSLR
ncbi:hypothetical protein D9M71_518860 [compost metagenome]